MPQSLGFAAGRMASAPYHRRRSVEPKQPDRGAPATADLASGTGMTGCYSRTGYPEG